MLSQARENWRWNPVSEWSFDRTGEFLTGPEGELIADVGIADPDQELARSQERIALLEGLLFDVPVVPHGGRRLSADHRAVLAFDPRDDGRFAEWHGTIDASNVGVFVPGTTTDLASVGRYNDTMLLLAGRHQLDTATITWMGTDLPDAVAADATFTSYTEVERAGERIEGVNSHGQVVMPGTDAFGNIVGVIRGDEVIPFRTELRWSWRGRLPENVYDDPGYPGTPTVPTDELAP